MDSILNHIGGVHEIGAGSQLRQNAIANATFDCLTRCGPIARIESQITKGIR